MRPRNPFSETLPAPEVTEISGDTAWDQWNHAVEAQQRGFEPTQPASIIAPFGSSYAPTKPAKLPTQPVGGGPVVREKSDPTLEQVMQEARRANRVCPQPAKWQAFYEELCAEAGAQQRPSPPLTGTAWSRTSSLAKRMCLLEQLEWAAGRGRLTAAHGFLKALGDADWHYMG